MSELEPSPPVSVPVAVQTALGQRGQSQAGQQEARVSLASLLCLEGFPTEINGDNSTRQAAVFNINIARFELM